jgi:hypothetical protein
MGFHATVFWDANPTDVLLQDIDIQRYPFAGRAEGGGYESSKTWGATGILEPFWPGERLFPQHNSLFTKDHRIHLQSHGRLKSLDTPATAIMSLVSGMLLE